jgi:hypothetical protein
MFQNKHELWRIPRCGASRHRRGPLLVLVAMLWLFITGWAALAGGDSEEDDAEHIAAERQVILSEQQFDQMVFGGSSAQQVVIVNGQRRAMEVAQPSTEADTRKRMESAMQAEMRVIHSKCSLTEAQKKKLQLAGRGDIHQFFSRVSELRPKLTSKPLSRQQYNEAIQELQPLRYLPQYGALGDNSLFRKTLRQLLKDDQLVRYRSLERERRVAVVDGVLLNWGRMTNGIKLTGERHKQIINLLVDHGQFPQGFSPYTHYIVMLEAARLEEQLKPLLDDQQWVAFQTQLVVARRVEPTLRRMGEWPISPPSDDDGETPSQTMKE